MERLGLRAACALLVVAASRNQASAQSDACGSATLIGVGTYSGSTAGATNDGSACAESTTSPDVWFRFSSASTCHLVLDTCGSSFDTVLSVHTGCPGTADKQLICNDDSCGTSSRVILDAVANTEYVLRIAGWRSAT